MKPVVTILAWVSVAAVLAVFFLPWALIEVRQPTVATSLRQTETRAGTGDAADGLQALTSRLGRVTVEIHRGSDTVIADVASLGDLPTRVSGAQIPFLAHQPNAKAALAVFELLTNTRHHLGARSYAVYLVPGVALLCGVLLAARGGIPSVAGGVAMLCAAIAGAGFWKALTAHVDTRLATITVGQGLWLSLWAYVGLAVSAGCAGFTRLRRQSRL